MKKVAIVVCAWPPQGGGIGNNAYYHAKKLVTLGYQVTALTPSVKNKNFVLDGGFILKPLKNRLAFGHAGFLAGLKDELRDFDIVHLYHPFFGSDLLVKQFKKSQPAKKLILHYEMDPVGSGLKRIIFWLYFKLFFSGLIRASDKVVMLSRDHGEHSYLKRYLAKQPEKFIAIPNGIDTDIFQPQEKDPSLLSKYNLKPEEKLILFVGGLDKQHYFKGVEVLLKSFQKINSNLPLSRLMIIGDGDLKNKYRRLAEDLKINDRVIWAGWVKNEELVKYYNLADVFVLPSTARTESFGIVTAEAQACGVPAVVSNWPGSRTTLADGETGFLAQPKDVSDLTEKISKILTDDNLKKRMSEQASERAKKLYSWDRVIGEIDVLYKSFWE